MVTVVSFWAPRPEHPNHRDYSACLRLQRESCDRLGLRHLVITEPGALDGSGLDAFETPLPRPLMRAILAGQAAFLASDAFDGDAVLVGADCLALRDPRPVFDGRFDLAVTTHPFRDCILNTGVAYCSGASRDLLCDVWNRALAGCGIAWGDDQTALLAATGATLRHGDHDGPHGLRLRCLPLPPFNDAPRDPADPIAPLFAHFRGARKDWMAEWWAGFLARAAAP